MPNTDNLDEELIDPSQGADSIGALVAKMNNNAAKRNAASKWPDRLLRSGGELVLPPWANKEANVQIGAGVLKLMFFKALRTETIGSLVMRLGSAGFTNPTHFWMSVFSINSSGDGTHIVSSADDTTDLSSPNTPITRPLESDWEKVAGSWYAVSALCVAGAGNANINGSLLADSYWGNIGGSKVCASISGQTSVPASFTAAAAAASANGIQIGMLVA